MRYWHCVTFCAAVLLAGSVSHAADDSARSQKTAPDEIVLPDVQISLIEQVEVPAQEAGVLSFVVAREGLLVEKGQMLAQIDDAEAQLDKRKAMLELDIARLNAQNDVRVRLARKSVDVLESELARSVEAVNKFRNSVSETELERQRLAIEKGKLEIEQATHDLNLESLNQQLQENAYALASRAVERRKITAPLVGMVVEVHKRPGEWVEPSDPVCRILRVDRLRVKGIVRVADFKGNLVGRPVVLTVEGPNGEPANFPGKVVFVSPEVNDVNGTEREIWAEVENRDMALLPGQHGKLTINRDLNDYDAQ